MRKKAAVIQTDPVPEKSVNVEKALKSVLSAAISEAELVVFPEMFVCPYNIQNFRESAVLSDGVEMNALRKICRETGIFMVAGSVPELTGGSIYNSSFVIDSGGKVVAVHRKAHLFDVSLPGFPVQESSVIIAGNKATFFKWGGVVCGVAVCYDIRFPEFMRLYQKAGVQILFIPAAFTYQTGKAHWHTLLKSRAIDYQFYTVGAAPAERDNDGYRTYGHSAVFSPSGELIVSAGAEPQILIFEVDTEETAKIKEALPLSRHYRGDIY
ncbi:MAG: carbon-nitrogen hydrolase family protein [Fibrobacterota bacterium]